MEPPADSLPLPRDQVAELLHRRYLAAFAIATALLLLNQLLVQPPLLRLQADAPVINVAGRQRMLSQRLAKASLALVVAETEEARDRHRQELSEVLGLWRSSHVGLQRGDSASSLPESNSPEVRAAFAAIEPSFDRISEAADQLIATDDPRTARRSAEIILQNDGDFLRQMDRIVGLYEIEARQRAKQLIWTGWLVTGLIVLALASMGRFVLVPAFRVIAQNLRELRAARDGLEDRVRERTAELETTTHKLAAEHAERLAVEGRHRALVEQLGHAARVNTIGEMAASLAHELNQPLGAIANYVGGCLERIRGPNPDLDGLRTALQKAHGAAIRAGETVRRIRRFVTRHTFEPTVVNPAEVAQEAVELVRPEAERRGIRLETRLALDLPQVLGDPVQLQQVLLNLMRNAFDAIEAKTPVNPRVLVRVERSSTGDVSFAVVDNGEGLGPEALRRLFEPFFSTRAEGMGMGLAISRGIVEAHHGKISANCNPGESTVVDFLIPAAGPAPAEANSD